MFARPWLLILAACTDPTDFEPPECEFGTETIESWSGRRPVGPRLGAAGGTYVATWFDSGALATAQLSSAGDIIGAPTRIDDALFFEQMVSGTSTHLLVGSDGERGAIVGLQLDVRGVPTGPVFDIGTYAGWAPLITATFDGTRYLVTWGTSTGNELWDIELARVDERAAVSPAVVVASARRYATPWAIAVATPSVTWLVYTTDIDIEDPPKTPITVDAIQAIRLDAAGTPLDPVPFAIADRRGVQGVGSLGDEVMIVATREVGVLDTFRLGPGGPISSVPTRISAFGNVSLVALVPAVDHYILWASRSSTTNAFPASEGTLFAFPVSRSGAAAGGPLLQLPAIDPAIVANGSDYLVATIEEGATGDVGYSRLFASHVSSNVEVVARTTLVDAELRETVETSCKGPFD